MEKKNPFFPNFQVFGAEHFSEFEKKRVFGALKTLGVLQEGEKKETARELD